LAYGRFDLDIFISSSIYCTLKKHKIMENNLHINEGLAHEVVYPSDQDYHGHPNYLKIYFALLFLFAISLAASYIDNFIVMVFVVFTASAMKALLVINYFMHLKWEPVILQIMIYLALFTLTALIIGVYADIPMVTHDVYKP